MTQAFRVVALPAAQFASLFESLFSYAGVRDLHLHDAQLGRYCCRVDPVR